MIKYILIDTGKCCILQKVFILQIPFFWIYCKIKGYKLSIFERRDLN